MCPQRTAAEVIRQRLQRKARQFLIFLIVACGVVANKDLFCCLFQSEAVFSSLVEYQERIALSSLANSYLFRKTSLLFTRF